MSGQGVFASALLGPELPRPETLRDPSGSRATRRFDVYRNNVAVALTEALAAAFPVVQRLVGETYFAAMARDFARAHPPRSPVMALYGAELPGWIERFPPLAALPYLPEVARIEQARREASQAADAAPLDPRALAGLSPAELAANAPRPHPATRCLRTRHAALAIWGRNAERPDLAQSPPGEVLITRPALSLRLRAAPSGTGATLRALARGAPLGSALPQDADHAAIFACLFTAGALVPQGDPEP
ncbi:DNA-binding domain-containing protein [Salipiger mangrovisoli]|uniref:DNA-binding domain-containing protein n=1 Tax=Salipiger mangrovisoli TaxID=2865933 RepID=A0ABR9WYL5_9RHOB|nr:DNA-binding domain-containing protein [Salipiger mangrovisoli]MBE9636383.1 putative DNA-binding domain-containing protein [Salipiger mangrovisoli]